MTAKKIQSGNSNKNKSFELDHILFWCGHFNSGNSKQKNIYIMTANSDLFDFYF